VSSTSLTFVSVLTGIRLQQLSFALTHVYARSTRSVSIVPPVYYADIICERGKHHFTPGFNLDIDTGSLAGTEKSDNAENRRAAFEAIKREYKSTHASQAK
jgi:eukaryotic translation initiation factor 2C